MNSKLQVRKILAGLMLAAVLGGCTAAPTAVPTSTPAPTIDVQPTLAAVATQAVETMAANLTLTAPSATPVIPTNTPAPTDTPAPTQTPGPTDTPTHVFIPWTLTPTPTQAAFACSVTSVSPSSGAEKKVDADFDGKWTVKNTGTKTWNAGNTDIRFVDGTKFQQDGDVYDLGNDVAPNGTYTIVIDMKAPGSDGTYSASWGIYLEDGTVCPLNLKINVVK